VIPALADGMFQRGTGQAAAMRQAPVIEVSVIGKAPPPRSKEGTHPGRVSYVRNTGTPTGSGPPRRFGRPTVRTAEFSGGNRMSKKLMPVGESRQETRDVVAAPPCGCRWITGRIPGLSARTSKGVLTWTGELVT
jgi:hypothetical protein